MKKKACGSDCGIGLVEIANIRCDISRSARSKKLSCPFSAAPDPKFCTWRTNKDWVRCGSDEDNRNNKVKCAKDEEKITNHWFVDSHGRDDTCSFGTEADYCCQAESEAVCKWTGNCIEPKEGFACPDGMRWVGKEQSRLSVLPGLEPPRLRRNLGPAMLRQKGRSGMPLV